MSDASTSAPLTQNLGYRLLRASVSPVALAHGGIGIVIAGLSLIAANGDAVGYRNASVQILERPAQVHEIHAHRTERPGLRPGLDLM